MKSRKKSSTPTRNVKVSLRDHSYQIGITSHDVQPLVDYLLKKAKNRKAFLMTDATVGPKLLPALMRAFRQNKIKMPYQMLPDGERFKNLKTVQAAYDWLLEHGADRESMLLALGGGVVGDIVGFVAATYMRGISFIQIPTTLVAQVDSSIGGKVGVDHKKGKNLIGSFYQPEYVHCDVGYLESLSERDYLSGLAEVIKYAIIRDATLFRFLEKERVAILRREPEPLERIVGTCCRIKADVVAADEKETKGVRMILNFGHTVGHAIESLTRYRKYRHGEAVALGMIAAARISENMGFANAKTAQAVTDIIRAYGLPDKSPRFSKSSWLGALLHDKKMRGDKLHFVFVETIGKVSVRPVLPREIVAQLKP